MDAHRVWRGRTRAEVPSRLSTRTRRPLIRIAIATVAAVLAVPLTLLATAPSASASTGGCRTNPLPGNSSVTVYTCAAINGSGTHVNYMNMHVCVYGSAGAWVRLAIYAPHDAVPTAVSQPWYRSHGNCTPEFYGPSGTVSPGVWTFISFDYSSGVGIANIPLTVRS